MLYVAGICESAKTSRSVRKRIAAWLWNSRSKLVDRRNKKLCDLCKVVWNGIYYFASNIRRIFSTQFPSKIEACLKFEECTTLCTFSLKSTFKNGYVLNWRVSCIHNNTVFIVHCPFRYIYLIRTNINSRLQVNGCHEERMLLSSVSRLRTTVRLKYSSI